MTLPSTKLVSKKRITVIQRKVLMAIIDLEATDNRPTIRDIVATTDVKFPTVQTSLQRLEKMGMVTWIHGRARTLRSLVEDHELDSIDVYQRKSNKIRSSYADQKS